MKKIFLSALMCLMALSMSAQRCAVLEFKAGVGISQSDVNGISAIFITYFRPSGYTMVERTQIDKVISEQGFQQGALTESQMVKIGQILNVSKIVVGDVNMVMGEYNVDVRVVDVQSGAIFATEGASFSGSSYRASMQELSQNLSSKIAIAPIPQGYVDLGLPSGKYWKKKNEKDYCTCKEAREKYGNKLPTREDWEELIEFCDVEWTGEGFKVIGKNLNYIFFPKNQYVEYDYADEWHFHIKGGDKSAYLLSSTLDLDLPFLVYGMVIYYSEKEYKAKSTERRFNEKDKVEIRLIH